MLNPLNAKTAAQFLRKFHNGIYGKEFLAIANLIEVTAAGGEVMVEVLNKARSYALKYAAIVEVMGVTEDAKQEVKAGWKEIERALIDLDPAVLEERDAMEAVIVAVQAQRAEYLRVKELLDRVAQGDKAALDERKEQGNNIGMLTAAVDAALANLAAIRAGTTNVTAE